ncbi:MAG: hypothetical protein K8J08_02905 [Thermoanaerobaculia bacterium]|nr:hypothetical protein [Thermoanaerobaculia bacterium]
MLPVHAGRLEALRLKDERAYWVEIGPILARARGCSRSLAERQIIAAIDHVLSIPSEKAMELVRSATRVGFREILKLTESPDGIKVSSIADSQDPLSVERASLRCSSTRVTRALESELSSGTVEWIVVDDLFVLFGSTRATSWHVERWLAKGLKGIVSHGRSSGRPLALDRIELQGLVRLCRLSSPDRRGGVRAGAGRPRRAA